MGVSKTQGRDRGQCRGRVLFFFFFLKNAVLGLGLRLVSTPRFIDGRDNIDLEGNFEKKIKKSD